MPDWKNTLYFGDNLDIPPVMCRMSSVDLVYLDPPFNSKASYNVLLRRAQRGGVGGADQGLPTTSGTGGCRGRL